MTFQQLQYLTALAESSSINQAAQKLFVSQSGISKAIKQLETELGFPLLERSSKGIVFTDRGMEFLQDAYGLLEKYEAMQERFLQRTPQPAAELSISSQHYIFVAQAIARIAVLLEEHSYVLHLREGKTSDVIGDVVNHRSQLGFLFYYHANEGFIRRELNRFDLEFHNFCTGQPHAYFVADHPLAKAKTISPAMLEPYPYICYVLDHDPGDYAEEIFAPSHPQKVIFVSDRSSMLNIIRHSRGYTLGSGWLLEGYTEPDLITRPLSLPADPVMQIGWITRRGASLGAEYEQFLHFCQEAWTACRTGNL